MEIVDFVNAFCCYASTIDQPRVGGEPNQTGQRGEGKGGRGRQAMPLD